MHLLTHRRYLAIVGDDNQNEHSQTVVTGISGHRPPAQLNARCTNATQANHEEHVKNGWTDNCTGSDVAFRYEDTEDGGEQLGRRRTGRHEGRSGNVVREAQLAGAHFERRQKVVITNDGQTEEHITGDQNMHDDEATASPLMAEQVGRKLLVSVRSADLTVIV